MSVKRSNLKDFELGNYLIKETIGQGTFGKVKLGINKITNSKVAIKILESSKIIAKDDQERVDRELKIIQEFNHPNVVLVTDIYKAIDNFFIVMEYCEGGELFNYIVKKRRLSEDEASFFFFQIINGLEYIHQHNVVHRDLKPENLLLTKDHLLKIIDFGLSNFFHKKLLATPCGSPCYASPEMVSGKKYNGFRIDIWSTGIILYAMVCGYLPFEDKENEILFKKILECKLVFPSHVSSIVKDLMLKILVTDPHKRITLKEIQQHPFFIQGKSYFQMKFGDIDDVPNILTLDEDDEEDFLYQVNKTEGYVNEQKQENKHKRERHPSSHNDKQEKYKDKRHHHSVMKSHNIDSDNKYANTITVETKREMKSAKREHKSNVIDFKSLQNNYISAKKDISPKKRIAPSKPKTNNLNLNSIRGLNSMRYPLYTTLLNKKNQQQEQTVLNTQPNLENPMTVTTSSANKPITQKINTITINHAAININMIDPNLLIDPNNNKKAIINGGNTNTNINTTHSNHKTSTSVSVGKKNHSYNPLRKSERKNPALKFYDFFKHNTTNNNNSQIGNTQQSQQGYSETVVKTQENYPLKTKLIDSLAQKNENTTISITNRKRLSSLLDNYKPILTSVNHNNKATPTTSKHGKINSLKLTDFYAIKKPTIISNTTTNGNIANFNYNSNISFNQKKKDFNKTLAYLQSHFKNLCYKDLVNKLK